MLTLARGTIGSSFSLKSEGRNSREIETDGSAESIKKRVVERLSVIGEASGLEMRTARSMGRGWN